MKIDFAYSLKQRVYIKDLHIFGTVTSLWYGETGNQYQIAYFYEGKRYKEYFYEFELEFSEDKDNPFGFTKK
jgi:hypothetical protein